MYTLVLNYAYMPISHVHWKRAISLVFSGRAVVEEVHEGKFVRSPSKEFPVPSIIRFLNKTVKWMNNPVRFSRRNLWLRDNGKCCYCGEKIGQHQFTMDHVIPKHQGGQTTWGNIVVSCQKCNQKKGSRTPEQANMKLLVKPSRPNLFSLLSKKFEE